MKAKRFLLSLVFILIFASVAWCEAAPEPPAKGQWAYSFESELNLYRSASFNARYDEVDNPGKWISVPSAVRDKQNNLWYKVRISGKTGWLPQTGIRLKMGPKSRTAANLYDKFAKKMKKAGADAPYTFSSGDSPEYCEEFFGTDIMGMSMSEIRKKLGTPTYRESPAEDIGVNWIYYELAGRNMTLTISLYREEGAKEGTVTAAGLYTGRAGSED